MHKKKKDLLLIIFLMIIVNLIVYVRFIKYPIIQEQIIGEQLSELTGEINNNNSISEQFIAKDNAIKEISIFFSTYNRENTGITKLEVLENNKSIYHTDINNKDILDNEYYNINRDIVEVKKGEKYELVISSDLQEGGVTAWRDKENHLVAKITYEVPMTWLYLIKINLIFLILNIFIVKFIRYLRS